MSWARCCWVNQCLETIPKAGTTLEFGECSPEEAGQEEKCPPALENSFALGRGVGTGPLVLIQTLGRAEDGVTSSRALLVLLHNRPRTFPAPGRSSGLSTLVTGEHLSGHRVDYFSDQLREVLRNSHHVPKYSQAHTSPHTSNITLNSAKSKRSPGTRPSYRVGKLPVLPQGEAQREIRC